MDSNAWIWLGKSGANAMKHTKYSSNPKFQASTNILVENPRNTLSEYK